MIPDRMEAMINGSWGDNSSLRLWFTNGTVGKNNVELNQNQTGDGLLLPVEDIDQFFSNLNFSTVNGSDFELLRNCSVVNGSAIGNCSAGFWPQQPVHYNYWALVLVLFPIFTLFGNVLVILSVYRERTLQTVTNYFIVSLALADLLVAVVVMPFAVYVLVSVRFHYKFDADDPLSRSIDSSVTSYRTYRLNPALLEHFAFLCQK